MMTMFEFYEIVAVPGTDAKEIKKVQCEEAPEHVALKERLEKEISGYERVTLTLIDRYYHCDEYEEAHPLNLAQSVFEDGVFVGYMVDDVLYVRPESGVSVYEEIRGATSFKVNEGIRRKAKASPSCCEAGWTE